MSPDPLSPTSIPATSVWKRPAVQAFWTSLGTVMLAEMGDKTQVSTLLMTAQSDHPWTVWVGAVAALVSTSLLGLGVGWWLAQHLRERTVALGSGFIFLGVALWLLLDMVHSAPGLGLWIGNS